jgi:hypothetical protein
MKLKRIDVKLGELLKGITNVSLNGTVIKDNQLYIVVNPMCWLANNAIEVVCVKTGEKLHANARYFKKTDKN